MSGPRPIRPTAGGGAGLTPSQEGNLNANTAARHTHTNKATLDATEEAFTTAILNDINQKVDSDGLKQLSTEDYTTAEKNKLGNITDSFKGFFADSTARDAAITTPASGFYVIQDDTDSVWFYDGTVWVNTGNTSTGDMLKAVYDPTSVSGDAYSMGNMVETASEKVFTLAERTKLSGLIPIDQPTIDRIPAQEVVIGTGATEVPTNANLSAAVCGIASFSGDVYTFTPVGTGFRSLQVGMYLSFKLPSGSANTTTTPDIDYNGSTYVIKWINGSALVADDLNETYNKQPILFYFDGTDMLITSDISGSNTAGKWIRKANGGQNCTRTYGQLWPAGGTTISIGISKSFGSADFSPSISWGASTGAAGSGLEKLGLQPNGTSNVSLTVVMNSSDTRDVYIQADGRWY